MWGLGTNLYNWLKWPAGTQLQTEAQHTHCLDSGPIINNRHMSFQMNCMWVGLEEVGVGSCP